MAKITAPTPKTATAAEVKAMAPAAAAMAAALPTKAAQVPAAEPTAPKAAAAPKVPLQQITVLAKANPKRPGTKAHRTFELYATSANTHEFIKQGGFSAALAWDVKHGFIKLS